MATSNLISKSLGKILLQSGNGSPDHIAPESSIYVDIQTGFSYRINSLGVWEKEGIAGIGEITNEPTGFPNRTDSIISFTDALRSFSITPSGTLFNFYIKGVKITKSSSASMTIPNVEGIHFIYFNEIGNLTSTQNITLDLLYENALVAFVYWDATNAKSIMLMDERHGVTMDGKTHALLHTTIHALYNSGLGLSNFNIGDGSNDTDVQFNVDDGSFWDEDILHIITNNSPQELTPLKTKVMYQIGTEGTWRDGAVSTTPYLTGANGRLLFNKQDPTTHIFSTQEITSGKFMLYHIIATNDVNNPILMFMGQHEYINARAAQLGAQHELENLNITVLPTPEFVRIGTVILESNDSFTNSIKSRIIQNVKQKSYDSLITQSNPKYSNSIFVLTKNDFPSAVNNVIKLSPDAEYIITTKIELGDDTIEMSENTLMRGVNKLTCGLTTTSANALIKAIDTSFILNNLLFFDSQIVYDIQNTTRNKMLNISDVFYVNNYDLGFFTGFNFISLQHSAIDLCTYGFNFKECNNLNISNQFFNSVTISYDYESSENTAVANNEIVFKFDGYGEGITGALYKNISGASITIDGTTNYLLDTDWEDISNYNIKINSDIPTTNPSDIISIHSNRFDATKGSFALNIDGANIELTSGNISQNAFKGQGTRIFGIDFANNSNISVYSNTGIKNYLRIPNYTYAELASTPSPADGHLVFLTDTKRILYSVDSKWRIIDEGTVMYTEIFSEDFEPGSTNTWYDVQTNSVNKWVVGLGAGNGPNGAGNNACYISNDGSTWSYTNNDTANSHKYVDVTIPAGANSIIFEFDWKGFAESGYDWLKVYDAPNSYTPPSTAEPNNSYLISGPHNNTSAWQTESINIPISEAGTTRRFIFSWRNDGSVGGEPSAIDNIKIKIT